MLCRVGCLQPTGNSHNEWSLLLLRGLRDGRVWLAFISLQLPSLRALFKYLGEINGLLIPAYLIVALFFTSLLLNSKAFRHKLDRASTPPLFVILLLIVLAVNLWLYPIADARSEQGGGSNQDHSLIITGQRLWHGENPYKGDEWPHESAAAGPGWIILASPLAASGLYVLLNPLIIALTASLLVYIRRSIFAGVVFLLLLMSSLAFWELTVVGSDMISIGCLILMATIAVYFGWQRGGVAKILSAILLGFVATSRAVFFYLVPLLAAFQRKSKPANTFSFLLISGGVLVILHLGFYLWTPSWYLPLHVFWKGEALLGRSIYLAAGLICLLIFFIVAKQAGRDLPSWILNSWITIFLGMTFAALGDLWSSSFQFAQWEGANYLGIALPGYAAYLVLRNLNTKPYRA
ncbi:hypothetical protein KKC97_06410 [bacterium]|nr:hypothetical protein [bacterium]